MSVNAVSGCGPLNGGESTDESATFTSVSGAAGSSHSLWPHDSGSSLCFLVYVRMIHVDGGSSYGQQGDTVSGLPCEVRCSLGSVCDVVIWIHSLFLIFQLQFFFLSARTFQRSREVCYFLSGSKLEQYLNLDTCSVQELDL